MGLTRRAFLQRTGLGLVTLGLTEGFVAKMQRYSQVLAQPIARKLALLVGINQYPHSASLQGCLTDVELQRELLIHRYGFQEQDILVLTDQNATREDIETAFGEHLTQQAKPGDIVVFHFSGYGSQVNASDWGANQELKGVLSRSLVPVDAFVQTKGDTVVNQVLEDTLGLMARSLATDQVTLILDTSYTNTENRLQGNLRSRSLPQIAQRLSGEELAFREQLQIRVNSLNKGNKQGNYAQLPGMVLQAANPGQIATEIQTQDFNAGLFTYTLTQHLWQTTAPRSIIFNLQRTTEVMTLLRGGQQQPQMLTAPNSRLSPYYAAPITPLGAVGVITAVEAEGTVAVIKLLGLAFDILSNYGLNSRLIVKCIIPGNEQIKSLSAPHVELLLQIRSQEGLLAKARLLNTHPDDYPLAVGQLVEELIRVLPRNLSLNVALDASLNRIEKVDATSAFAIIPTVTSIVSAGEQSADCLLNKVITDENTPTKASYGLYTAGGRLIPDSIGSENEAIKLAVYRLKDQLETLLAVKLWRLTLNENSSRLPVRVILEKIEAKKPDKPQLLQQRETVNGSQKLDSNVDESLLLTVDAGSQIRYRVQNLSDRTIYAMIIAIDTKGKANILSIPPINSDSEKITANNFYEITPNTSLTLPQPTSNFNWILSQPSGITEIEVICSEQPFTNTVAALAEIPHPRGDSEQLVALSHPLAIAQAILQDLHNASDVPSEITGSHQEIYALNVNSWASFRFILAIS